MSKVNRVKNAIMQVTYFLNGPVFNLLFYCHVILYWVKMTSYEKFYPQSYPWSRNYVESFRVLMQCFFLLACLLCALKFVLLLCFFHLFVSFLSQKEVQFSFQGGRSEGIITYWSENNFSYFGVVCKFWVGQGSLAVIK